jgi:hypothetical protein
MAKKVRTSAFPLLAAKKTKRTPSNPKESSSEDEDKEQESEEEDIAIPGGEQLNYK